MNVFFTGRLLNTRAEHSYPMAYAFYLLSTGMLQYPWLFLLEKLTDAHLPQDRVSKILTPAVANILDFRMVNSPDACLAGPR